MKSNGGEIKEPGLHENNLMMFLADRQELPTVIGAFEEFLGAPVFCPEYPKKNAPYHLSENIIECDFPQELFLAWLPDFSPHFMVIDLAKFLVHSFQTKVLTWPPQHLEDDDYPQDYLLFMVDGSIWKVKEYLGDDEGLVIDESAKQLIEDKRA